MCKQEVFAKICSGCGNEKPTNQYAPSRLRCNTCLTKQKAASEAKRIAALPPLECAACRQPFHGEAKMKGGYNRGTYCSPACRAAGERATRIHKSCPTCQKAFWHWPSHEQTYCGVQCAAIAAQCLLTVNCKNCNKPTQKKPCDVKRTKHQFCSAECNQAFKIGPNHPNFIHGKTRYPRGYNWGTIRKGVLLRDNHTCQRCGAKKGSLTKKQRRLEVHHITPFAFFMTTELANALPNLITYCHACHWIVERQGKQKRAKRQMVLFAA